MPKGMKGFQPGRAKTGGRPPKGTPLKPKPAPLKRSNRLVDQLKSHGFDYHRALAQALKALPSASKNLEKYKEWAANYKELKDLLPFMSPKLREKEVDTTEQEEPTTSESQVSTEDILKAINPDVRIPENNPAASNQNPMAKGSIELLLPPSTEVDLSNVGHEQEEK